MLCMKMSLKCEENMQNRYFSLHIAFKKPHSHHKNKKFQHWISQKNDTSSEQNRWRISSAIVKLITFVCAKWQRKTGHCCNTVYNQTFEGMHGCCRCLVRRYTFSVLSPTVQSHAFWDGSVHGSFTHRQTVRLRSCYGGSVSPHSSFFAFTPHLRDYRG